MEAWWQPIAAFLPDLHPALRPEEDPQFRASMQCRGHRGDGESFLAEIWFSSYKEGRAPKLAAINADVSEDQTVPHTASSAAAVDHERAEQSRTGRAATGCPGLGK